MNPSRHSGAIRELLQTGGRTMAQGALGWRLARSENTFPIPGFKIEAQACNKLGAFNRARCRFR